MFLVCVKHPGKNIKFALGNLRANGRYDFGVISIDGRDRTEKKNESITFTLQSTIGMLPVPLDQ
jgi:hypothetical protein